MDKSWMLLNRVTIGYQKGLDEFLDFAFERTTYVGHIQCPCIRCVGRYWLPREQVKEHLTIDGFKPNYQVWDQHGEQRPPTMRNRGMEQLIHDRFPFSRHCEGGSSSYMQDDMNTARIPNVMPNETIHANHKYSGRVQSLLDDARVPLYPGCVKMKKLEFLIRLYHGKCQHGITNGGIDFLLDLFKDSLPDDANIPRNHYEASKLIEELGFTYNKIHCCPNDCMLYWEDNADRDQCIRCGTSRWEQKKDGTFSKVPQKLVWHFPLIPRLQRLYMSEKTSTNMRWHEDERTKDEYMRHPADGKAWQEFNKLHPDFAADVRNVRLALSSDGFNPFKQLGNSHSTWPVFIHVYNLPPWMCMKKPFAFMTLLIPGPVDVGNDIDIYLQPLIAELKQLWDVGVPTYDILTRNSFNMRAALMWTINDFPAYAMLSGWSTKGKLSCPICAKKTRSRRLESRRSFSFMGHRRFLRRNHQYRQDKNSFDGTIDSEEPPKRMSGNDVLKELDGLIVEFGKDLVKDGRVWKSKPKSGVKRKGNPSTNKNYFNWRKKSIFFELPYWKTNLLRHCLDVMHVEKNVSEALLGTLLNVKDKSNKDDLNSRFDLELWGIRSSLHAVKVGDKRWKLPLASYVMNASEKRLFLHVLENIRVPDGYSSNISKRVNTKEVKLRSLKSHDHHILMQELLPIALRRVLPNNVRASVIRFCNFYRDICAKKLCIRDLSRMVTRGIDVLCDLEKIFPPAFFTCMVHLTVHLASEVYLGGPVCYRWMYPTERNMYTLKKYVRNRNRPEGSIAEGYLAQECLDFCSMYLENVVTRSTQPMRNQDEKYEPIEPTFPSIPQPGGVMGSYSVTSLTIEEKEEAHRYILFNCDVIDKYIEKHKAVIKAKYRMRTQRDRDRFHSLEFPDWFKTHVKALPDISEEIKALAGGPNLVVRECSKFVVNGFKFNTHRVAENMATQNSGVMLAATTECYASSRDTQPRAGTINYFGVVERILILDYYSKGRVVLMKCIWYDTLTQSGIKTDDNGFTLVNRERRLNTNEHYILASQADQVFYVDDPIQSHWSVVVRMVSRHIFDDPGRVLGGGDVRYAQNVPLGETVFNGVEDHNETFVRADGEYEVVVES